MNPALQDTLLQLFEHVHNDPDSLPAVPIDEWQEGSIERQLLISFSIMMEQVQQRTLQFRKMEHQLREREEQYRSVFEATGDGLFVIDLDGFIVEANPAAYRQLGYTYEEIIGLHRSTIVNPEYHSLVPEYLRVIQMGDQFQGRAIDVRKDGTTFPVEVLGRAFTYKGRPHTLSVVRDITKQVQAEEQLREREEQYRSIFEAVTDSLTIGRQEDGQIVEANPAACKMLGYSYEELIGRFPADLVPPDFLPLVAEGLQEIQIGERNDPPPMVALRKDGSSILVEVHSTQFTYKEKSHHLTVSHDITERVQAEEQLREREEQYRGVFEATYDGLIITDLDGFLVEVNPAFCSMYGYTREELIGTHTSVLTASVSQHTLTDALETFKTGRGFQTMGQSLRKDGTTFYVEGRGMTFTYNDKPHTLSVIRDITERVQAQQILEQRVEERTRELSTLLEVSHNVASTLELKPLLNLILNQIKGVVEYTAATILILDGVELVIVEYLGPAPRDVTFQVHYPVRSTGVDDIVLRRGEPVIIDDVRASTPLAQDYREAVGDMLKVFSSYLRALMVIPLKLKDRVIGMLSLSSSDVGYYTPHHTMLAQAIANQAAIAIENARLYEQAQELAVVEERQRLARELHDSVSQALYGISLGVHTARMQLDRDPRDLAESLDYVLELAEAALIEMRALIFELRPESLETEGLVTALTKQAAALHARQNIAVDTDLCAEPDLPLKVKQDLYRIAQEALHNTVKHAHASKLALRLHQTSEAVTLEVCDNGRGFDTTASFPGHLGLHSMQERVTGLGGELQIESTSGQGTCIRVRVPGRDAL